IQRVRAGLLATAHPRASLLLTHEGRGWNSVFAIPFVAAAETVGHKIIRRSEPQFFQHRQSIFEHVYITIIECDPENLATFTSSQVCQKVSHRPALVAHPPHPGHRAAKTARMNGEPPIRGTTSGRLPDLVIHQYGNHVETLH